MHQKTGDPVFAAAGWEAFRRSSVSQGDFTEKGAESVAVWSHILDLDEAAPGAFAEARAGGLSAPVRGLLEGATFEPANVFRRLADADPRPEVFERWVSWGRRVGGEREATAACEAWRRARPEDPRPLLVLVEQAEKRGALKKAVSLLARAEAKDRLDPAVACARFRLTAALALKHLRHAAVYGSAFLDQPKQPRPPRRGSYRRRPSSGGPPPTPSGRVGRRPSPALARPVFVERRFTRLSVAANCSTSRPDSGAHLSFRRGAASA